MADSTFIFQNFGTRTFDGVTPLVPGNVRRRGIIFTFDINIGTSNISVLPTPTGIPCMFIFQQIGQIQFLYKDYGCLVQQPWYVHCASLVNLAVTEILMTF